MEAARARHRPETRRMGTKIENIFFDIGNVLLAFDWGKAAAAIGGRSAVPPEQILLRLADSRIDEYERGAISTGEFFADLGAKLQYRGSVEELALAASDIFFPLEKNVALARDLSERYRLGIISNINQAHVEFLESRHDFFSFFQARIYSCAVGSRKPECRIFDLALQALDASPDRSLFIDDLEQNVAAARRLGWNAVRALPGTDLGKELRRFDVS
jgi:FMN phosphatase YigB (HAD superfamily)